MVKLAIGGYGGFLYISFCARNKKIPTFELTTPSTGNCVLMKHASTEKIGCFDCANRVCIDPPQNYEIYKTPFAEDDIGVPYRCFETDQGCALAE